MLLAALPNLPSSGQPCGLQGSGKNARVGVLLVHGFTGAPPSMRPWGEFLHSKGYTVRVPLLPGHGTKPEDLNKVKWQEWPAKVQSELDELFKSCDQVFVAGLSMGGGTALNVAQSNNDIKAIAVNYFLIINICGWKWAQKGLITLNLVIYLQ